MGHDLRTRLFDWFMKDSAKVMEWMTQEERQRWFRLLPGQPLTQYREYEVFAIRLGIVAEPPSPSASWSDSGDISAVSLGPGPGPGPSPSPGYEPAGEASHTAGIRAPDPAATASASETLDPINHSPRPEPKHRRERNTQPRRKRIKSPSHDEERRR